MDIVNANNIETIVRDKRSLREMFALKFGEWYPKDKAFHTGFALLVLMGKKKLLKLTEQGSPQIPKAKDSPELDKENLFNIVNRNENLRQFIPDNSKPAYFSIEFMHSLLYHKDRSIFDSLYKLFETRKKHANESVKKKMNFEIPSEVTQKLVSYKSNFNVPKSKPFFQIHRYKDLFIPYMNNQENMNINNQMINRSNNVNVNMNQNQINNNLIVNDNHIQHDNNHNEMIIRNNNDMYFDLVRSLFDYMVEINYHNIGMVVNSDNTENYKVKIFELIKVRRNYDSFRVLNVDDQIKIIFDFISNDYLEEIEIEN